VLGVVLPFAAGSHAVAIEAVADVGGAVDVDIHIAAAPVATAEYRTGRGKAHAPGKAREQRGFPDTRRQLPG
jgi:hypothetical protein